MSALRVRPANGALPGFPAPFWTAENRGAVAASAVAMLPFVMLMMDSVGPFALLKSAVEADSLACARAGAGRIHTIEPCLLSCL